MAFRTICVTIALGTMLPCAGDPQSQPRSLADATLEELMNIEVTSVSKKAQPLSSTAASIFVITAEDIRRSGITILPELLRLAPGVQVARVSSGSWAISIRGFNDDYSNKLLVLIDGRSVYNQLSSGVYWDALNPAVDDVERIEVIRGPGAAMWGTNAVNGVINIITMSAKSTQGGRLAAVVGSETNSTVDARYGGQVSGAFYRVGARNIESDPYQIQNSASPSQGWANRSADFRADWDASTRDELQVSGGIYRSTLGTVLPNTTISSPYASLTDGRIDTNGGNIVASWRHAFSEASSIEVRFSYDRMFRNDPQLAAGMTNFDYGFQQHVLVGSRHDVIWGIIIRDRDFYSTSTAALGLTPSRNIRDEVAIFAQDEIALIPARLSLIVGAQVSHTSTIGYAIQPTGRLLWTPARHLSTWIGVSRAVRTPSLQESGLNYYEPPIAIPSGSPLIPALWGVAHVMGNPSARTETLLAYETGQRVQPNKRISFDLSTFYNSYHHLMSVTTGAPLLAFLGGMPYLDIPVKIGNERYGESYGAELAATWNATSSWRLTAGYSWLRVETRPYTGDINGDELRTSSSTPHHQWDVRSNFDLTRTIQIDTAFYYTAAMPQTGIPQHLRGDLRIGWRPVPKFELSIGVQDAFEANHVEYESMRFNQLSQVPRNFYGKVTWRF